MGRLKVQYKNEPVSISLPVEQIAFIQNHSTFNLSKFVQIHLQDHINTVEELEELKNE